MTALEIARAGDPLTVLEIARAGDSLTALEIVRAGDSLTALEMARAGDSVTAQTRTEKCFQGRQTRLRRASHLKGQRHKTVR